MKHTENFDKQNFDEPIKDFILFMLNNLLLDVHVVMSMVMYVQGLYDNSHQSSDIFQPN